MPRKKTTDKETLSALEVLTAQLAEVSGMRIRELRAKYQTVFGIPTNSRNADYLRKEIARKLQERAEGGLTERAEIRIKELGDQLPERWRRRLTRKETEFVEEITARDPRLPKAGTVLSRMYEGRLYQVTVRNADFEYEGQTYSTLSRVARAITGKNWNGFEFFKLDRE